MILYRMAKWMEERELLTNSMKETSGDTVFLRRKRELADQEMWADARRWMAIDPSPVQESWSEMG